MDECIYGCACARARACVSACVSFRRRTCRFCHTKSPDCAARARSLPLRLAPAAAPRPLPSALRARPRRRVASRRTQSVRAADAMACTALPRADQRVVGDRRAKVADLRVRIPAPFIRWSPLRRCAVRAHCSDPNHRMRTQTMGQCCEASPGADVAGVSPVPVQMWSGARPVTVQMWAGASPFSPGADVARGEPLYTRRRGGAAYARWFSVFVVRGASASTCQPNAFEWSLPRGRAAHPNNRHANAPSARSSAVAGAVHICAATAGCPHLRRDRRTLE